MLKLVYRQFVLFGMLTALTGLLYPLAVTGAAQLFFSHQANGSLVKENGAVIGSELIGQYFNDPRYFWGRPSSTAPVPYNAAASAASNWGPQHLDWVAAVKARAQHLSTAHGARSAPSDLLTASGSGLDPHISPEAALFQAERVAKARGLGLDVVRSLVQQLTEERVLGILGEPRVNVFNLNRALDRL